MVHISHKLNRSIFGLEIDFPPKHNSRRSVWSLEVLGTVWCGAISFSDVKLHLTMLYHWRTASTNLKLGLVLLTIALVVFIAGLSSGFWVKRDTLQVDVYRDTYGLWVHNKCDEPRGCHEDPLNSVYLENRGWTGEEMNLM